MDNSKINNTTELETSADDDNVKIKRSYYLTKGCIKTLQRMKLEDFPFGTSLEFIVEKAIIDLSNTNIKKD